MPAIGSSSSSIFGSAISARANSSSLRWPPESTPAYSSRELAELEDLEQLLGARAHLALARRAAPGRSDQVAEVLAGLVGRGQHHVVDHRHPRERLGDLKRAHHAEPRDHVRRAAR